MQHPDGACKCNLSVKIGNHSLLKANKVNSRGNLFLKCVIKGMVQTETRKTGLHKNSWNVIKAYKFFCGSRYLFDTSLMFSTEPYSFDSFAARFLFYKEKNNFIRTLTLFRLGFFSRPWTGGGGGVKRPPSSVS